MIWHLTQRMLEMDVESLCSAAYGERSPERAISRNGHRERTWDTRAGTLDLKIPKLRKGSYFQGSLLRNALAHAGKGQRQMVLAMNNTAFAQDTQESATAQWRRVADQLRDKFPKLMDDAESDVLAFMSFPKGHRVQIHSTNALERLNAEIKRRTDGCGHLPK